MENHRHNQHQHYQHQQPRGNQMAQRQRRDMERRRVTPQDRLIIGTSSYNNARHHELYSINSTQHQAIQVPQGTRPNPRIAGHPTSKQPARLSSNGNGKTNLSPLPQARQSDIHHPSYLSYIRPRDNVLATSTNHWHRPLACPPNARPRLERPNTHLIRHSQPQIPRISHPVKKIRRSMRVLHEAISDARPIIKKINGPVKGFTPVAGKPQQEIGRVSFNCISEASENTDQNIVIASNIATVHTSSLYPESLSIESRPSSAVTPERALSIPVTTATIPVTDSVHTTPFALPRYFSPQTREMCELLERHGKTADDLAIGIIQIPGSNLNISPRYIPTTNSSPYLSQKRMSSRKHSTNHNLLPLRKRIRFRPGLWLRIGALIFAIIAVPLYVTTFKVLKQDEYVQLLGIHTSPLQYAIATASSSLILATVSIPVHLWPMPYIVCCASTVFDSLMLLFWLITGFISINPTDDANNPSYLLVHPSYPFADIMST
ncbi:hypothetical protein BDF19DRAFT_468487 [Syncephalis fuscata]|nr:hypothetical protein BDF19DRAFT_468487 [Syncephalis fuscata]